MKRSKFNFNLYLYLTLITVLLTSLVIAPYYVNGDQIHYYRLYEGVANYNIFEGYVFYTSNIDSREPLYYLIIWLSSHLGIDKIHFVTFVNAILSLLAYKFITKTRAHPLIAFIIIVANYYSFVLFFSAERLKVSFIFLLLSFIVNKNKYLFVILSILSHAQSAILYLSIIITKIKKDLIYLVTTFKASKSFLAFITLTTVGASLIIFILKDHIISKLGSYYELRGIIELLKLLAFFFLSLWYAKDKSEAILFFIPLFFFALILGGERINFLGYFAFLYFALSHNRGFNFGIITTSLYFAYTGIGFINNVLEYGDGFHLH